VFALDVRTGTWRWQYERPQPSGFTIYGRAGVSLQSGTDVMEGDILYTGFDDGRVVALDTSSGEALAIADLSAIMEDEFSDVDTTPLLDADEGQVLVAAQSRGVHALSPETLEVQWVAPVQGVSHVSHGIAGTYVAVSSLEGVVCLQHDGAERWRARMNPGALSRPALVGETLFVAHSEDGLLALDARTGELLAGFDVGSGMTAPPTFDAEDRRLYATSNRGRLFVFRVEDDI
jgi:outer membrane protein assembly factor BamB